MSLSPGEHVHVVVRRRFESDLRRHLVGEVVAASDASLRLRGYLFLLNMTTNEWVRDDDLRELVIALGGGDTWITVLPPSVSLDALRYRLSAERRLVLSDGAGYELDINEFGLNR